MTDLIKIPEADPGAIIEVEIDLKTFSAEVHGWEGCLFCEKLGKECDGEGSVKGLGGCLTPCG